MIRMNEHYRKLQSSYLFSEVAQKVATFQRNNPDTDVIKLGIGDVTRPLPPSIVASFQKAVEEMAHPDTFRGYGPEQGYAFLRDAIAREEFQARGAQIEPDEIFVSDGTKCDIGNFQELFAQDIRVAIGDPVYPVYLDTNVMAGRTGEFNDGQYGGIRYLRSTPENSYIPAPPSESVDLVYLCFPNNPTGAVATLAQLADWVAYAQEHQALILFDAAYEAFIRNPDLPRSIFEIDGAERVAVEFRSFSKTAGFTGTRCAYTIVPKAVQVFDSNGEPQTLHALWNRRHNTKFNGVAYPIQRAAEARFSEQGKREVEELVSYYLENARIIREAIGKIGYSCTGGENSPYIWVQTGGSAWQFFDRILSKAGVVVTPGIGFGPSGEGHVRISAFNDREKVEQAMHRIEAAL